MRAEDQQRMVRFRRKIGTARSGVFLTSGKQEESGKKFIKLCMLALQRALEASAWFVCPDKTGG